MPNLPAHPETCTCWRCGHDWAEANYGRAAAPPPPAFTGRATDVQSDIAAMDRAFAPAAAPTPDGSVRPTPGATA